MTASDSSSRTVSCSDAVGRTVGEIMMRAPKTLPGDALVADVRRAFDRPTVRTVLLAESGRFVGAIERDGLPADADEHALARSYVEREPVTVTPATPMRDAIELIESRSEPRLIVLDEDGVTLQGLLCAKPDGERFCVR